MKKAKYKVGEHRVLIVTMVGRVFRDGSHLIDEHDDRHRIWVFPDMENKTFSEGDLIAAECVRCVPKGQHGDQDGDNFSDWKRISDE